MMRNIFAIGLLLSTTACFGGREATAVYNIEPQLDVEESSCKGNVTIEIGMPTTAPGLEGRRISVVNDAKMNFYNGVRWAAPISEMVQEVLVESFEKSRAFKNISTDIDGVEAQYILLTDIRDYQVTDSKNPKVKVRMVSKLISNSGRNIIATIPVEKEITPEVNKTQSLVDAFGTATAEAAADIINATRKKVAGCKK